MKRRNNYRVARPLIRWTSENVVTERANYWAIFAIDDLPPLGIVHSRLTGDYATQHEAMTAAAKMELADRFDRIREKLRGVTL